MAKRLRQARPVVGQHTDDAFDKLARDVSPPSANVAIATEVGRRPAGNEWKNALEILPKDAKADVYYGRELAAPPVEEGIERKASQQFREILKSRVDALDEADFEKIAAFLDMLEGSRRLASEGIASSFEVATGSLNRKSSATKSRAMWLDRPARDRRTPAEFTRDTYADELRTQQLTRPMLRNLDRALYQALATQLRRARINELPQEVHYLFQKSGRAGRTPMPSEMRNQPHSNRRKPES